MSKKILIIPAVLLLLVLAAGAAVLAYDDARPARIAEGLSVGGVDVGGLDPAVARARVEEEVVASYERPVVVDHGDRRWRLRARQARVETNAVALVDEAMRRSEEGGVIGRTVRRLKGGRLEADLEPEVTFSDRAVVRMVDRVRKRVERPARDATMKISAAGVTSTPSERGLEVRARKLRAAIKASLRSPTADRRFVAETRKVRPKVTEGDLLRANSVVLIADRASFTLRVYKQLELARTYPIAVGKAGNDTPPGQYTIANKAVNPAWTVPDSDWAGDLRGKVIPGGTAENPLKARWLGIAAGVGIHGTSDRASIGSNASHGCLRMLVEDVVELYPQVPVGAKILIA